MTREPTPIGECPTTLIFVGVDMVRVVGPYDQVKIALGGNVLGTEWWIGYVIQRSNGEVGMVELFEASDGRPVSLYAPFTAAREGHPLTRAPRLLRGNRVI